MMDKLITDFTSHLKKAIEIGNSTSFKKDNNKFESVLICGLGGSGIGGTIVSQLLKKECKIPININKDYFLPEFVSNSTLVICCSYSGNTEETLHMYKQAVEKEAELCIITSGGRFKDEALNNNLNLLEIPGGLPPRAAFGLSFPQLIFAFTKYGLISENSLLNLEKAISLIEEESDNIKSRAYNFAKTLKDKIPVVYSEPELEGVSVRFRQQINENSKMLCWHHVIPELNHNELVGWRTEMNNIIPVLFRRPDEYYRNTERFNYLKNIVSKYTETIIEIYSKGNSLIEESLYLIHLGDWISYYLSELKGIDPVEVDVITGLKELLAELK